jgi:uncharacterized membrane protein YebE (DUF533 family)
MVKSYKIFVPLVLLFLMSNLSLAQDDFREKIEEVKLEKLTKKLELDDNTKENFIEKYKSFSKTMRTLKEGKNL